MSQRRDDDLLMVRSRVGPDQTRYLPNRERVQSLVSQVYADALAQLLFSSLQGSWGFQGYQAGHRMEEKEN